MDSVNKAPSWTHPEPYDTIPELDENRSTAPNYLTSIDINRPQSNFDGIEAICDGFIGNFNPSNSNFLNAYNPVDTDKIAINKPPQPPTNSHSREIYNSPIVKMSIADHPPDSAKLPPHLTTYDQRNGYSTLDPNGNPGGYNDSSFSNPSINDGSVINNEISNSNVRKAAPTLVAVFGKTGTGKTTFIKSVTGLNLVTSDKLASCTKNLETFPYKVGDQEILLVDTPGFDDTNLSDTAILFMIADWMEKTYEDGTLLSGIIYLHKITDNRMDGASMKSLRLFRSLCGEDNLSNVILGTTMWGLVDEATGVAREKDLQQNYWKELMDKKTSMRRISTDPDDAKILVESFLRNVPFVTQIQRELKSGTPLSQTGAGAALRDEMEKMSERYKQELETAKRKMEKQYIKQNASLKKELMTQMETLQNNLARIESEKIKLEKEASKARLPKQTRGFFTGGKWECLGGCRTLTSTKGEWYCKRCKIRQKNIR